MPTPDAAGVVVLQSGETYEASELEFAGVMHVESTANELAVVKVPNGLPWTIKAAQVAFNGVQILSMASDNETPAAARDALVDIHCDVLSMRNCIVRSPADDVLLRWTPLNNATSVVSIQNSVLHGGRSGVWLTSPTKRCTVKNSLFKDVSAIRCDIGDQASTSVRFDISHVTQVGGHGFVDIVSSAQRPTESRIEIECGESVLAPKVALVRLAGGDGWSSANSQVAFLLPERGNPTIVPPNVDPAVYFDRSLNQLVALPENQVVAESILFAAPVFRTPAAGEDPLLGFQLVDYEGPKLSLRLPGADVTALPQFILDESSHGIEDKVPTARR